MPIDFVSRIRIFNASSEGELEWDRSDGIGYVAEVYLKASVQGSGIQLLFNAIYGVILFDCANGIKGL